MDPVSNPYAPGAGTPPPELAGRDELRETVRVALAHIRAGRPVTDEEVAFAKRTIVQGYPRSIETNAGVVSQLADLAFFGLPEAEMTNFLTRVLAVRPADVTRVARRYLQPDQFTIVVVGDLATIRPGIEALHLGPVTVLDADGMALQ